jgi:predicted enzyme related to lactoylglutathione lyase
MCSWLRTRPELPPRNALEISLRGNSSLRFFDQRFPPSVEVTTGILRQMSLRSSERVIPADDVLRATAFYAHILACTVRRLVDGSACLVTRPLDGVEAVLAVVRARSTGEDHRLDVFTVQSVGSTLSRIRGHGGMVLIETADADGRPLAWCQDTEGNRFIVEQAQSIGKQLSEGV